MFRQWFSKLAPVHHAVTQEEKEAVYRFRYQVFAEEGYRTQPVGMDAAAKRVTDENDAAPETTILYTGRSPEVTGCVRLRTWEAGSIPEEVISVFSLELFPGLQSLRVAEVGPFIVRPSLRGTLLLPSLVGALYEQLLGPKGADMFLTCVAPELVPSYRKLGLRPYGGSLVDVGDGMAMPLVGFPSDVEFLKRCDSLALPVVKENLASSTRPPLDLTPFAVLLEAGNHSVKVDPDDVWSELQEGFFAPTQGRPVIFDGLDETSIRYLADHGFIVETLESQCITHEGAGEREVYVVLEGIYEASIQGRRVGFMGKGDTFGELAFFRQSGRRVATVYAKTSGRLLVLGRSLLDDMTKEEPELAVRLLFNLGRLMAERTARDAASE